MKKLDKTSLFALLAILVTAGLINGLVILYDFVLLGLWLKDDINFEHTMLSLLSEIAIIIYILKIRNVSK